MRLALLTFAIAAIAGSALAAPKGNTSELTANGAAGYLMGESASCLDGHEHSDGVLWQHKHSPLPRPSDSDVSGIVLQHNAAIGAMWLHRGQSVRAAPWVESTPMCVHPAHVPH